MHPHGSLALDSGKMSITALEMLTHRVPDVHSGRYNSSVVKTPDKQPPLFYYPQSCGDLRREDSSILALPTSPKKRSGRKQSPKEDRPSPKMDKAAHRDVKLDRLPPYEKSDYLKGSGEHRFPSPSAMMPYCRISCGHDMPNGKSEASRKREMGLGPGILGHSYPMDGAAWASPPAAICDKPNCTACQPYVHPYSLPKPPYPYSRLGDCMCPSCCVPPRPAPAREAPTPNIGSHIANRSSSSASPPFPASNHHSATPKMARPQSMTCTNPHCFQCDGKAAFVSTHPIPYYPQSYPPMMNAVRRDTSRNGVAPCVRGPVLNSPYSPSALYPGAPVTLATSGPLSAAYAAQAGDRLGTGDNRCVCSWVIDGKPCGKAFSKSDELTQHVRAHTNVERTSSAQVGPCNLPHCPCKSNPYSATIGGGSPVLDNHSTAALLAASTTPRYHPYARPPPPHHATVSSSSRGCYPVV